MLQRRCYACMGGDCAGPEPSQGEETEVRLAHVWRAAESPMSFPCGVGVSVGAGISIHHPMCMGHERGVCVFILNDSREVAVREISR
jgi:hypothetical protein